MGDQADFTFSVKREPQDFDDVLDLATSLIHEKWRQAILGWLLPFLVLLIAFRVGQSLIPPQLYSRYASELKPVIYAGPIIVAFAITLGPFLFNALFKIQFLDDAGSFLRVEEIIIDANGVIEKYDGYEKRLAWPNIIGVRIGKQGYFICHDRADGIYLPYRSLGEHKESVGQVLESRLRKI